MRVILDLLPSPADRVTGTLITEGAGAPVPFDGWLELMRLLETVRSDPSSPPNSAATDNSRSPRPPAALHVERTQAGHPYEHPDLD